MKEIGDVLKRWLLEWLTFLAIFVHPLPLLMLAATVGLVIFGAQQSDKTVAIGTAAITSIAAGFVGGIWMTKRWTDATDGFDKAEWTLPQFR